MPREPPAIGRYLVGLDAIAEGIRRLTGLRYSARQVKAFLAQPGGLPSRKISRWRCVDPPVLEAWVAHRWGAIPEADCP